MTGKDIFDIAINLMDEQNESSGETVTADTKEYELRSVRLLNAVFPRLCMLVGVPFTAISSLEDKAPVSDSVCSGVASYELAALLVQTDGDSDMAERFRRDAENNLSEIVSRLSPGESEDIEDSYGGIEFGEFSRWG